MAHQKGLYPLTPQNEKRPEQDSNLRPSAPEADALSAELSGPGYLKSRCNRTSQAKKPLNETGDHIDLRARIISRTKTGSSEMIASTPASSA